jgi:hypothetical protein
MRRFERGAEEECWLWRGHIERGYGRFGDGECPHQARRLVHGYLVGPILAGHALRHECGVRNCVNPAHLLPARGPGRSLRGQSSGR